MDSYSTMTIMNKKAGAPGREISLHLFFGTDCEIGSGFNSCSKKMIAELNIDGKVIGQISCDSLTDAELADLRQHFTSAVPRLAE